ncbi:MAG TPA: hypothetical protein VE860_03480, partial [Chthoniobacterales bacterium]|nr:hypothetical protein [Chthoniobacterales bacterium]
MNDHKFHAFIGGMFRAVFLIGFVAVSALSQPLKYPSAKQGDVVDDYFGTKVPDPYRWLENPDSPETTKWIAAENKITSAYLDKLPDRAAFREELTKLLNYERFGVPKWEGGCYVYSKNSGLQNQSVFFKVKSLSDAPEILLDPNQFASDGTVAVTSTAVSDNGRYLAYGTSVSGSDWNDLRVRDIETGKDLPDVIRWVKFSESSWTKDSKGFFYARFPAPSGNETIATLRNQKIYYHHLGDLIENDRIIYERPDAPDLSFESEVSKDGRYLFTIIENGTQLYNLLYFKDLGNPSAPALSAPLRPIVDKFHAQYKPVGSIGNRLFVITDLNAAKYRILEIDLANSGREHWKQVIPESN